MTPPPLLNAPVTTLPLVGTRMKNLLARINIRTIGDLLYHFPFRYEDFSQHKRISELMVGDRVTLRGSFRELTLIHLRFGKTLVKGVFADESGSIPIIWFNQPYILSTLQVEEPAFLAGIVGERESKLAFINPTVEKTDQPLHTGRLLAVYPETKGISSKWLRRQIFKALSLAETQLKNDYLPEEIKKNLGFPDLYPALRFIHFPLNPAMAEKARQRFAFEEIFFLQLKSILRKKVWEKKQATVRLNSPHETVKPFLQSLPFALTTSQQQVLGEILSDLAENKPMNRLLQGDVGSGKTVVATAAAYVLFRSGYRIFYMAPTEILAQQHYQTLRNFLQPFGARVELVVAKKKSSETRPPQSGNPDVTVGTHALLYRNISTTKVGLLIIDEQHRFGVEQRGQLLKKIKGGTLPHVLTMTATPIPRTLALTLYGDLNLSLITELPPARLPVKTWVVPPEKRNAAYEWIKKQLGQAFVVCPFIEESEIETLKSVKAVVSEFKILRDKIWPEYRLGLLHGRLKSEEKDKIVQDFRDGKIDILVSTPVVEVGVDIPQANIMVIEGASHFGLASLHQLRGRVGRGSQPSYCLLFSDDEKENSLRRLKALEKYQQGQKLAELDLRWRGAGEIFGTAQHGFPQLKIAHLTDATLVKTASDWAWKIANRDPKSYQQLQTKIREEEIINLKPN